jgi:hypothetical protein
MVAYVDRDFHPVPRAEAALWKVIYPDGRIVFAIPTGARL